MLAHTPALWSPVREGTFEAALPLHPTTMEQAFHLGILHERLTCGGANAASPCYVEAKETSCGSPQVVQDILRQAETVGYNHWILDIICPTRDDF
jgi:hypothetical protein